MSTDPLFERLARALTGRYALERELGHGGMGAVYLATDLKLGRPVAIKVLPPATREYLGAERFQREVRLAAALSHPHIVPLFEADEADGVLFYVMEYVEGETLRDRLDREGPLPLEEALRITAEVGDALQYAHERGIVHRDIKPANVLLCRDHALVADFGIAKAVAGAPAGDSLTGTGVSVGTAEYMSPEQAGGDRRIDARTDVYSLAAVLYEMLAGEPPFSGPTLQAVVARVMADSPRPIRTVRPNLPAHVERALSAGLAKLPAERPPTVRAFVDMIERPAAGSARGRPHIPRWLVWAGAAVLLALGARAMLTLARRSAPGPGRPAGMVLVPEGRYPVGGGPGRPAASVQLDSFYVDSTEVPVGAYERFREATRAPAPRPVRPPADWPVTGVLWAEAQAYCRWRDSTARLPTEEEWEAAARGPQGFRYPWGDAWVPGRANADSVRNGPAPVGGFALGTSWVGAVDLIGNAWEWTAAHVIKGGAFDTPRAYATAVHRSALPEDRAVVGNTGFRCVRPVRR